MNRIAVISLFLLFFCSALQAQDIPSISEKALNLEEQEGFFTYYRDEDQGKILVEIEVDRFDTEFLYVNSLTAGVGSNDIGLDRNQLGDDRVVYFERRGSKVLLVQPNYSYRAITNNPKEEESVRDAFARSVLWGFEIVAEEGGTILIDLTDFLMRDAHGVSERLKQNNEGNFSVDKSRSALYEEATMNFPQNTEFESILTFTGSNPGGQVRSVAPTSDAITVRQHHSFVELPDDDFEPRTFDPRAGYFGISYQDYSTPIGEPLTKRFITRHRLEKKNPGAEMSEPVEPIVYYLDPGTPEPVRGALLDGARWWNEAFEAAGYKDAFRVEILPDSAHPMDVRYNMINWVHRSTRGWSYGSSVVDPRTGEIIKGHVLLGSLRVRQDYLIAEGLLSPYKEGETFDEDNPMLDMALARIRQLSAHEVGHTLGLAHNFAASTNSRASVMDYPAPKVTINPDSTLNLDNAYDTGIGEWDKVAITYGYKDLTDSFNNEEALNGVILDAIADSLLFISDADARPESGAHPKAHLWDNGSDAVKQLDHIMDVRDIALENFSESNIPPGTPMAKLEDALVPIYLFHRYQIEGTVKLIGGLNYSYDLRGGPQSGPEPVADSTQRAALNVMLQTISPDALKMPEKIIELIPPRPLGYSDSRELFNSYTDPAFDPLGAAETAANMTMRLLLNKERAARLVDYKARDSNNLGLGDMLTKIINQSWKAPVEEGYKGAIQNVVNHVVLYHMMNLGANEEASSQVRSIANLKLEALREWMRIEAEEEAETEQRAASLLYGYRILQQFKDKGKTFRSAEPLSPPPGSPIGSDDSMFLRCSFR
ncbi:zinc-dependent metalloprotease [Aliifodinibius salicampi]|uniref:Zinc-dependent metalloprotease n=1 Tax=Fodinibius salicampi TaxID=1920655 RepID=A0ABT3Q2N7_9BACT|nr:zinc-dependent metalloprotease [Fodinibius salicampi]MCW9714374.1 zinc-dependent metalloprotease [Fodinibius salicampi]